MSFSGHKRDVGFELFYRKGWAHLLVYPASERGKPVYPEDVESRMRLLGIPKVSTRKIREIIKNADGGTEPLVEWPEGSSLASDIKTTLSEDSMKAWITLTPPKKGANPPTVDDIMEELQAAGITYGLKRDTIAVLLERKDYNKQVLIAEGDRPVHGRSARIEYHFDTNRGKPYLVMEFDRINLKELNFIENKKEGDLVAELLPPVKPKEGRTVTDTVIPAMTDTAEVRLEAGTNTRLNRERTALYADCDGNVKLKNRKVIIEPVVTVENVNYETGNIYFDGSVVVNNNIADGFVIEADGDIQVGKGVGKASLKAGGNILLKTGINGNNEGKIECGGNLFAKYIESSTVLCRGNMIVEEAIMHSHISVWKHCALGGRRSEIIAGNFIIGGTLWCKKLGSMFEARTFVSMGVSPELLHRYRETKQLLEKKQDDLNKLEEKIEQLHHAEKEGIAPEKIAQASSKLHDAFAPLNAKITELKQTVNHLRDNIKASKKSRCIVEDTMYKGVVVLFGTMEYRVPENGVRKTILKAGEQQVVETGFNYHDRPKLEFE